MRTFLGKGEATGSWDVVPGSPPPRGRDDWRTGVGGGGGRKGNFLKFGRTRPDLSLLRTYYRVGLIRKAWFRKVKVL